MSKKSRRREQDYSKRAGETYDFSNPRLPRAHESVRRMLRDEERSRVERILELARPKATVYPGSPLQRVSRYRFESRTPSHPAKPNRLSLELRRLRISKPHKVAFCVRRKQRREVLFAMRVAGERGVGRGRAWRRKDSQYTC